MYIISKDILKSYLNPYSCPYHNDNDVPYSYINLDIYKLYSHIVYYYVTTKLCNMLFYNNRVSSIRIYPLCSLV